MDKRHRQHEHMESFESYILTDQWSHQADAIGPYVKRSPVAPVLFDNTEQDYLLRWRMVHQLVRRVDDINNGVPKPQFDSGMFEEARRLRREKGDCFTRENLEDLLTDFAERLLKRDFKKFFSYFK